LNLRGVIIKTSLLVIIVVGNDFWNWGFWVTFEVEIKAIVVDGISLLENLIVGVGEV
jgi:hypothetical protein